MKRNKVTSKQIENFLERDIYKIPVPEELVSHPNTSHVVMTEGANVTSVLKDEIPIKVVEMLRRKEMLQKEEVMPEKKC